MKLAFADWEPIAVGISGEMGGASQQKPDEAAQEVAPLDVRPCGRSLRIGSFCDVVAAPAWVQACGWAVGRVRNASRI